MNFQLAMKMKWKCSLLDSRLCLRRVVFPGQEGAAETFLLFIKSSPFGGSEKDERVLIALHRLAAIMSTRTRDKRRNDTKCNLFRQLPRPDPFSQQKCSSRRFNLAGSRGILLFMHYCSLLHAIVVSSAVLFHLQTQTKAQHCRCGSNNFTTCSPPL